MKAVLKHAGRWLHFQCPERVLTAHRVEEVMPLLREAEASGLYAAGWIAYEAAPAFDPALKTRPFDGFPLLQLGLFPAPAVLDGIEHPGAAPPGYSIGALRPSVSREAYRDAIARIRERIAEGATYQVNYTYRLNARFDGDPWGFFCELVNGQKTEHAAFIETEKYAVCSASPELFFSFDNGRIVSRPMKGTARRGRTLEEDLRQAEALQRSAKDRAENIMIVDMIRNDIGRVAEPGSVETRSTFDVEKYPTLWQMTSTVEGKFKTEDRRRRPDSEFKITRIMQALFPCASITGAPKAKTMEIIRELETTPRGIYTGAIGFITSRGEAAFNVAIRTAVIDRASGELEYGVGGGIVWDSEADAEYEETLTKARILTEPRPAFRLLETMLREPGGGIFLLDEHLERLTRSAAYFDIPLDLHAVQQALEEKCRTCAGAAERIRLLVAANGEMDVQAVPVSADRSAAPLRITLAKEPVDSHDIFLFHKTTHRAVYENARSAFPDADDVILFNERGEVTEGTIANLVIRREDRLITPPVACGLLAGTFRAHLLRSGEIEEGIITVAELNTAEEIHLINSVRKWQRAVVC